MIVVAGVTPGWNKCTIFLDDVNVEHCYAANDDHGIIIIWPGPQDQKYEQFGKVRIEFADDASKQMAEMAQGGKGGRWPWPLPVTVKAGEM